MLVNQGENDWIGSKVYFFNTKTSKIGTSIYDVIDYSNFRIDPEGFKNYLEYGYSVFGHTIIEDVGFLLPNEGVKINDVGQLEFYKCKDSVIEDIHNHSTVDDTLNYMEYVIKKITDVNIVLPLSGGYDSRLIAYFIEKKQNVHSFTYGISKVPSESYEVKNAEWISKTLNINWKQVELNRFYEYTNEWIDIYGPSVHAHGMYHMEFYDKIRNICEKGTVISGIIGDGWAGNVDVGTIDSYKELKKLGYSHGMCANINACKLISKEKYKEEFWQEHKDELKDRDWRVVWTMRTKMMLLRYLCEVPASYGYFVEAPFLDYQLSMKMLNLDWNEKKSRKWQTNFLDKIGLLNRMPVSADYGNMMDLQQLMITPLPKLEMKRLREYVDEDYIEWINDRIGKRSILYKIDNRHWLNAVKYFGIWKAYDEKILQALYAYLVLYPVDRLLAKVEEENM